MSIYFDIFFVIAICYCIILLKIFDIKNQKKELFYRKKQKNKKTIDEWNKYYLIFYLNHDGKGLLCVGAKRDPSPFLLVSKIFI